MWLERTLSFLIFLQFGLFSCLGDVVYNNSLASNSNRHHDGWHISEEIHKFCFNPTTRVIILPDNWQENQSQFLTSIFENLTLSYIFGEKANEILQKYQRLRNFYKLEPIHLSQKNYPATSVTIFVDEGIDFSALLESLRRSVWWNSRAKFLLVGFGNSTCSLALKLLRAIWDFSVLSAIYLCQNTENKWALYTFNPYSHWAPSFWTRMEWNSSRHEDWSLLQHVADGNVKSLTNINPQLCKTLYFDKLKDLNDHTFRALTVDNPRVNYNKSEVGYGRIVRNQILSNVLKSINVIYTVKLADFTGFIKDNGQPYDNINEVISGKLDFSLLDMFIREYWWLQTYPYFYSKIHIFTPNQSRYAINFLKIFTPSSWMLLSLIGFLTILSLKYILKSTLYSSTFEFIRIFVNSTTVRHPVGDFERICLIFPIYLWLILNIYIQSSFKADRIAVKQNIEIDSVEQLINSNLSVHAWSSFKELIANEKLRERFVSDPPDSCIQSLIRGESIACLIPNPVVHLYLPKNAPVHVSKEHLIERGGSWLFPEDSPLLSKVNSIMSRFNEAGLINYHYRANKIDSQTNADIKLELFIALRILIGGWLLALVVAVIEIIIGLINHIYALLYIS